MYILNFSFLAQFGGVLCDEQTQKIRKNHQKPVSLRLLRHEMGLKSRDPRKRHIEAHLLNVHIKFQLRSPIWKGDGRRTALFWVLIVVKCGDILISPIPIDLEG